MPARRQALKLRNALKSGTVFNPRSFLATAGIGRTLRRYNGKQVIFAEGERADTILYIAAGSGSAEQRDSAPTGHDRYVLPWRA
jgi:CRP-like cAMP-binding protein